MGGPPTLNPKLAVAQELFLNRVGAAVLGSPLRPSRVLGKMENNMETTIWGLGFRF